MSKIEKKLIIPNSSIKEWWGRVRIWRTPYFMMSIESTLYMIDWVLLAIVVLLLVFDFNDLIERVQKFTLIGVSFSLMFSLHGMWIAYVKLRTDVYNKINEKYDNLNNDLAESINIYNLKVIDKAGEVEKPKEKDLSNIVDYINLCAEEYELFNEGLVINSVWLTWVDGMVEKFSQCNKLYAIALNLALGFEQNIDIDVTKSLESYNVVHSHTYYNLYKIMCITQLDIIKRQQKIDRI